MGAMVADRTFSRPTSTVLPDRNGELWALRSGGRAMALPAQTTVRPLRHLPHQFEDRHFQEHHGIHFPSLVWPSTELPRRHVVSGGSTLTMQVARLSRGASQRSYMNKLVEPCWHRIDLYMEKRKYWRCSAPMHLSGERGGLGGRRLALRPPTRPPQLVECATLAVLPNARPPSTPARHKKPFAPSATGCWTGFYHRRSMPRRSLAHQEPLPQRTLPLPNEPRIYFPRCGPLAMEECDRSTIDGHL